MKPVALGVIALLLATVTTGTHAAEKLNVLFIAADDMRPQLGCYGDPVAKSPSIDALAQRGMLFNRSYVQQALCSPSRISMLSGRYPATTGIFEIGRPLRATMPDITTFGRSGASHAAAPATIKKLLFDRPEPQEVRRSRSSRPAIIMNGYPIERSSSHLS